MKQETVFFVGIEIKFPTLEHKRVGEGGERKLNEKFNLKQEQFINKVNKTKKKKFFF